MQLWLVPLHSNQQAYRAGKSVETALHQLVGRVEKPLDKQETALAVFLHTDWAFNSTSYDSTCVTRFKHGVGNTIAG
jgi:hypothetical protein